jgi:hypothetical protein
MYTEISLGAFAHKYNACTFACKQKYNAADVKKQKKTNTMLQMSKKNNADVEHYTEHLHV